MKIATWNVARLQKAALCGEITDICSRLAADILILTETDARIMPDYPYACQTACLKGETVPAVYADTENRVTVFSRFPCVQMHPTFDTKTAVCAELQTEAGNLLVYGTVIGITGNRSASYIPHLKQQLADITCLVRQGYSVCMIGDFNCSFADHYYFTKAGRRMMLDAFAANGMTLLTGGQPQCIDHIAVSNAIVQGKRIRAAEWNTDKRLSDHKGIAVTWD